MRFPGILTYIVSAILLGTLVAMPKLHKALRGPGEQVEDLAAVPEMLPDEQPEQPEPEPEAEPEPDPEPKVAVAAQAEVFESPPPTAEPPDPAVSLPQIPAPPPSSAAQFAERLPEVERADFLVMVEEGRELLRDRETLPGYRAIIPPQLTETLVREGVFRRVVVQDQPQRIYVVVNRRRTLRVGVRSDIAGFADRVMLLDDPTQEALAAEVSRQFGVPRAHLTPAVLVQIPLDEMVLAAQARAAERLKLPLEHVVRTDGSFRVAQGVPFRYEIRALTTTDGRVQSLSLASPTREAAGMAAVPANYASAASPGRGGGVR